MKAILRRFPFTLMMLILLGLAALWINTHAATISVEWLDRLGFAPLDLLALGLGRLFTSALVTSGRQFFWEALVAVAFAVGLSERLTGACRAALTFWGVHFSTLLIESLFVGLPLHWALKSPWNVVSGGVIFIALEIALLHFNGNNTLGMEISVDIAHNVAFPLGWYSSKLVNHDE